MSSIMTNASALTALQSLNSTNKNLETTQSRISTGFRVATASDNAAYWSIATTMRSDKSSLSVVQDALGLGAGKVDTAYSTMNKVKDVLVTLRDKLEGAVSASTDATRRRSRGEINALQDQLKIVRRRRHLRRRQLAVGENHRTGAGSSTASQTDAKIVSAFNRDTAGKITLETIDVKVESIKLSIRHQPKTPAPITRLQIGTCIAQAATPRQRRSGLRDDDRDGLVYRRQAIAAQPITLCGLLSTSTASASTTTSDQPRC